ncbi:MAG: exodeoxyribonuclease III [Limisphaerales bacterium]
MERQWPARRVEEKFSGISGCRTTDVLCLQETKCTPDDIEELWPRHYTTFWNSAQKKGYSGTAIFIKTRPLNVAPHIGIIEHDKEGRVLAAELDDFFLVNVYVPNSKRDLSRLDYRQEWDRGFSWLFEKTGEEKARDFLRRPQCRAHRN